MSKVVLITGASSGIGYEAAKNYISEGYTVYGCARRVERMKELEALGVKCINLDITDELSIKNCIDKIINREGQIDILINNAGYGTYGPMENTPIEDVRKQFEVNFFGLARITQLVIPYMRKNKSGCIVNVSSMGGRFTIPFGGWYHATKYAIESYSDSLRQELKQFNIKVIIIEPGTIQTEWGVIAANNIREIARENIYQENLNIYADYLDARYLKRNKLTKPKKVADTICRATKRKRPKTRYKIGITAKCYILLKNLFSDRQFDYITKKSIGLHM